MTGKLIRVHEVERTDEASGLVDIALVRTTVEDSKGLLRHHREVIDRTVLFHRTFRPLLNVNAMESYAARLALVARHANESTFGCFVRTESSGGNVKVTLYERWFDGTEIHTDQLAQRSFDATDDATLVSSAEFVAELEAWPERQNDEREAAYQSVSDDDELQRSTLADEESASQELADILASHARSD